ncbi:MAG: protein translocase subunit SecDF [Firmicutes bacterium HGW-Firmicutes-1]|jgi:SecD/SecF fusion protein|nr:MAG: protein translocase subunit SecDF [Firmicutes bacterium HGW-Firmicutes-1]
MKGKSILGLVLMMLVISAAVYIAYIGVGVNHRAGARDINLGLDLEGGVSITYTTVKEEVTSQEVSDTIYKLAKRLDEKGYTEAEVYKEGNKRINVDIPGAKDANQVLAELGKPGKLEFKDEAGNVVISGEDVKDASVFEDAGSLTSRFNVRLELNEAGTKKFAEGTAANINKIIEIYYNDTSILKPTVSTAITDGIATISGMGSIESAGDLASTIRIGALPLELQELRSNVVGAKMGQDAISTSVKAGIIGIVLIFVFMIIYYRIPGLAANIGLAFYSALLIIIISIGDITLTLPGIAGLILSVGMAVDANVIIFARIREELAMEKTLRASVNAGFKKAMSAILDGNITTFIVAIILFVMGTGTIKGFAVTLALGIVISMFTAFVVTRIILNLFVAIGITNKKLYGVAHEGRILPIIAKRKLWFAISIAVIAIGLIKIPVNLSTQGEIFNKDIEFAGGTSTLVSVGKHYNTYEEVESDLLELVVEATGVSTPQFQNVEGKDQVIIKTSNLSTEQRIKLEESLVAKFGIDTSSIESQTISATVSNEMKRDALIAIILSTIFILIYITIRFKDYKFGISSIIALVHDVMVMITVYLVFNIPINNAFIAAILTIIGYSINDTIVVFDRIRENQKHMKRGDYQGVVDLSVSQTFSRSINTSLTVFIVTLVLNILGVEAMRQFTFPLLVGTISGAYSSIFVASPIWYLLKMKEEKTTKSA